MTLKAGIYGATGYTGLELVRLLHNHPDVTIHFATSESSAGQSLRKSSPQAPALMLVSAEHAPVNEVGCVFLCLPHTRSAPLAALALAQGVRVVDLSADLRLDDPAVFEKWYKVAHPAPDLLPRPYGLPELGRDALKGAMCIANPGCYATTTILALAPLVQAGMLIAGAPVIVDAKSGASGAGRAPKQNMLFCEVHGDFSPYNIGRSHRHVAEIDQVLGKLGAYDNLLIFSPHLLPTDRGILATAYVQVTDMAAVRGVFEAAYANEPLIDLLPAGELASLAHVVRTPKAALSLTPVDDHTLIVVSVTDNLLKGAASQAVQNFNLMFDLPETTGLL